MQDSLDSKYTYYSIRNNSPCPAPFLVMGNHTKLIIKRVIKLYLEGTEKGKYTLKRICKILPLKNNDRNR